MYASAFKECKYIEKKVVRHIHDNLSHFSSDDDESDEKEILKMTAFSVLLTRKYAYKVYNAESYFFNLFIINHTLDKVSHWSFKQKGNNKTISLFYLQFFYFVHKF